MSALRSHGRRLAGCLLAAALLGLVARQAWLGLRPEPAYQGKTLSQWLAEYPEAGEVRVQQIDEAVRHLGASAIPGLLDRVSAYDSPRKLKMLALLNKQPWIKISHKDARERLSEAERGFIALGAAASNAVPALIAIYRDAPSLEVQDAVAVAFGEIGPPAGEAVPLLIPAMTNTDFLLGGNAVWAIGRIHRQPALAVPALLSLLENTSGPNRCNAAQSLACFKADAAQALPALTRLLSDPDPYVHRDITNALRAIDAEAAEHVRGK